MDWLAAAVCALGVLLIAYRRVEGWPVGIISNLLWMWWAVHVHGGGLVAIEVFLIGCNALGWWKWAQARRGARGT